MTLWWMIAPLWILSLVVTAWIARRQAPLVPPAPVQKAAPPVPPPPPPPEPEDTSGQEVAGRLAFREACTGHLAQSIIDQLRSTTEPLTHDLVAIRSGITTLVSQVQDHQSRMASGEDLAWVDALGTVVNQDMAEVSRLTQQTHLAFGHHVSSLRAGLETILQISQQIKDLSEKINVLSINASVEAARAGTAGRGFKVIAAEVKTLARETTGFLGQIETTVATSRRLFEGIGGDLQAKSRGVSTLLARQEASFTSFRRAFSQQRLEFEGLYQAIVAFTDRLDGQVSQISPVVQLHDIAVQELENLMLVSTDAWETLTTLVPGRGSPTESQVQAWAAEVRHRLTTGSELVALNRALATFGVVDAQTQSPRPGSVELF